jgi:hypothetical protein
MIGLIKDHSKFTEAILEQIQKLPFGALPKSELELAILHSLVCSLQPEKKYWGIHENYNELKKLLRLSNTQLKNKLLAAQLRFDSIDFELVEVEFLRLLSVPDNFEIEGQYLVCTVFNPLLNDTIKSYFETKNILSDTSFNKSIIKINLSGILKFIDQSEVVSENQKNEIIDFLGSLLESEKIQLTKAQTTDGALRLIDWAKLISATSDLTSIVANIMQIVNPT